MGLVAVCTVKGSAGATSTALGVAAALPASAGGLMVECDPSGGDLALRYRLPAQDGLVAVASAARGLPDRDGLAEVLLGRYATSVPVGDGAVEVVPAPAGGRQAQAAVSVLAEHPTVAAPAGRVAVADCGRLEAGSPVWPLLADAEAVLLVVSGTSGSVARLLDVGEELTRAAAGRLGLVVAAGGVYGADVIGAFLAEQKLPVRIAGRLPHDPRTAAVLAAGKVCSARWRRSPLGAALVRLADTVYAPPGESPAVKDRPAGDAVAVTEVPA